MKRVKITVRKEEINGGRPRSPGSCPVALAIERTIKDGSASVYGDNLTIGGRGEGGSYLTFQVPTPQSVYRFIGRFDKGREVGPFYFWLLMPDDKVLLTEEHNGHV